MVTDAELDELERTIKAASFKLPVSWDGERPADEDGPGYVPECSYLGGTNIALSSTYEYSREDCAAVKAAVNAAPGLIAEVRHLRKRKASRRDMAALRRLIGSPELTRTKADDNAVARTLAVLEE